MENQVSEIAWYRVVLDHLSKEQRAELLSDAKGLIDNIDGFNPSQQDIDRELIFREATLHQVSKVENGHEPRRLGPVLNISGMVFPMFRHDIEYEAPVPEETGSISDEIYPGDVRF